MSKVTKELVLAYMLEGLAIGLVVSSINTFGSIINDRVDEEKKNTRRIVTWVFTLLAAFTSHVLAESLRHDRILGLLKNLSNKLSFKNKPQVGTAPPTPRNLFRKRSILQDSITPVTKFN